VIKIINHAINAIKKINRSTALHLLRFNGSEHEHENPLTVDKFMATMKGCHFLKHSVAFSDHLLNEYTLVNRLQNSCASACTCTVLMMVFSTSLLKFWCGLNCDYIFAAD